MAATIKTLDITHKNIAEVRSMVQGAWALEVSVKFRGLGYFEAIGKDCDFSRPELRFNMKARKHAWEAKGDDGKWEIVKPSWTCSSKPEILMELVNERPTLQSCSSKVGTR